MSEACLFCKIIRKEIPCTKIFENSEVLAFLDIGPVNKGHTLVIPKRHNENIYDIPEEDLKQVIIAVKKVSEAIKQGLGADGISIAQSNEKSAGQVVPHFHFHVMPRLKDDGLKLWPQGKYEEGEADSVKEKIVKFL